MDLESIFKWILGYKLQNAVYKPAGYNDAKDIKGCGMQDTRMHRIQDAGYKDAQDTGCRIQG